VRLGRHLASGAVAALQLFDERKADAKYVRNRALRAKPARVGRQDLLW
jgi:hypothetical protein